MSRPIPSDADNQISATLSLLNSISDVGLRRIMINQILIIETLERMERKDG